MSISAGIVIAAAAIVAAAMPPSAPARAQQAATLGPAKPVVPAVRVSDVPTIGAEAAYKQATRIAARTRAEAASRTPKRARSASGRPKRGRLASKAVLVRQVAAKNGLSEKETWYLLEIARLESGIGTNPSAYVPTRKYIGIFQLGPHLGTVEQRLDDVWNTERAIKYIRGRYGTFAAAYSFRIRKGWY